MADIAPSSQKINDIEVASDAPLTEALHFKYGGSINYLIDTTDEISALLASASNGVVDVSYGGNPNSTSEIAVATFSGIAIPNGGSIIFWFDARRQSGFPDATAGSVAANFYMQTFGQAGATVTARFKRDSTSLLSEAKATAVSTVNHINGNMTYIDTPPAGTYTYTLTFQYSAALAGSTMNAFGTINYAVLPFS